jgi:hypothetical protein
METIPTPKPSMKDYRILRVLGKGSFGEVFLVRKLSDSTLYALKSINKAFLLKVPIQTPTPFQSIKFSTKGTEGISGFFRARNFESRQIEISNHSVFNFSGYILLILYTRIRSMWSIGRLFRYLWYVTCR